MRLVVLEEIPEDADLRRCWNKLVQRMERPQVFYTYDWALAVQRAYGKSLGPLVFLAYDGASLAGVAALAREKNRPGAAVFLTRTTADYCDFVSEPGRSREFIEAVLAELESRRVGKIVLANLPADSASADAISGAASICRYHLLSRPAYLCARVVLGSAERRAVLKVATRGKKMLRRNLRHMSKQAPVDFRHETRWEEIEPALQSFFRAHIARFLATGRISNLIRSERRVFLYELARGLSRSGWTTLSRLFIGEIPVAWNYGFQFAGSWFWYQPTLDSRYEAFSPGFCLLSKIVETACDLPGLDVVDLGLGAEYYKERFATSNRQTSHITLNRSLTGHCKAVARNRAAAVATASLQVERWIRKLIAYKDRFRRRFREGGFLGLFAWSCRRIWSSLFSVHKVLFFRWPARNNDGVSGVLTLRHLDFDLMGAAVMHYGDEPSTLDYLMRSAQRLRAGKGQGFALLTAQGAPVHFCWVKDFEGFQMDELKRNLQSPCADAVLIFDCFTPPSARGSSFFANSISLLADQLHRSGKVPWIFAAAENHSSIRGIEKSGFAYRFCLGRKRILFLERVRDSVPSPDLARVTDIASARNVSDRAS